MTIGTAEVFLGIMVLMVFVLAYIAYTLIKQLRTLEKTQARRIFDLMVMGSILYWLDIFIPQERSGGIKIQAAVSSGIMGIISSGPRRDCGMCPPLSQATLRWISSLEKIASRSRRR